MQRYDVDWVRSQFPSLHSKVNGHPAAFFDAPAAPRCRSRSRRRWSATYRRATQHARASSDLARHRPDHRRRPARPPPTSCSCPPGRGLFRRQHDHHDLPARQGPRRGIWQPGDEVVITDLDHEANRGPWLTCASAASWCARCRSTRPPARSTGTPSSSSSASAPWSWPSATPATRSAPSTTCAAPWRWPAQVGALAVVDAVHYALHGLDRRARPRLRLPALLRLQVLRPARGRAVLRAATSPTRSRSLQAAHPGRRAARSSSRPAP